LSTSPPVSAARLCALNAGIQLIWGAILGVSLQARCLELVGRADAISSFSRLAAAGALIATIVQIVAGLISDRVRRRSGNRIPFYLGGTALAIPALFWFYIAPTFAQLILAFLALQFAMNVAGGPYQAVIPDFVAPNRRGGAASWMAAYQSLGNALGLIAAFAIRDAHLVALALAAPFAGTCAVTVAAVRGRSAAGTAEALPPRLRGLGGPLGALLVSRGLINIGFFTLLDFLLFYVERSLGVPDAQLKLYTGTMFLGFTLAAVPGAIVAARPTDRYDKRIAVSVSVTVVICALALLAATPWIPLAYGAAALAGLGWGAFVTADWALAAALLPQDEMATAMGIWNAATALPQVVAPLVTAPLVTSLDASHAGAGPRGAIVLALLEFAAGAVAIWRLPRA
jgi:MFS family permease